MAPLVHLTTPDGPVADPPLPVLVQLSVAELLLLTTRAGNPRLPLDLGAASGPGAEDAPLGRLHDRLAGGAASAAQQAHELLAAAYERVTQDAGSVTPRLRGLGLLDDDGTPHPDVLAALAALAAPEALLVLDLAVGSGPGEQRLRSFLAVSGTDVTQLSTASGLTYELSWFPVSGLPDALARAATVPAQDPADPADPDGDTGVEAEAELPVGRIELPWEVFTDGTEAVRRGRDDLLAEIVRIAPAPARVDDAEVSSAAAADLVRRLETAADGRLRVLVGAGSDDAGRVGVVSWLRVGTSWRALSVHRVGRVPTVRLDPVGPEHLAGAVAPVLAQVVGGRR